MGQQSSVLSRTLNQCLSYLLKQQVRFVIYSYPLESEINVFVDQASHAVKSYILNTFNTLNSEELKGQVFPLDNWELIKHPSYKGYANLDESLLSFASYIKSKTGILLDPLYTGPMLYQLFQLINRNIWNFGKNILLIHTGGTQSIAGFNIKYQTKWPEH